jgi:hypothetical protein
MSAGKGDKFRPVKKTIYDKNYDKIKWGDKKEEKKPIKKGRVRYTY